MTGYNQRRFATVILAAIVMTSSLPVLADPTYSTMKISVSARNIDLSTPAGVETLRNRMNAAVRAGCAPVEFGGAADFGTHDQARAQNECLNAGHAAADAQIRKVVATGTTKVALN